MAIKSTQVDQAIPAIVPKIVLDVSCVSRNNYLDQLLGFALVSLVIVE